MIFENRDLSKTGSKSRFLKGFGMIWRLESASALTKRVLDMGSNHFFDGFEFFGILTHKVFKSSELLSNGKCLR